MVGLSLALSAILLLWATTKIINAFVNRSRSPYPPGPRPKPFIGNALDIPLKNAPLKYMEIGKRYNSGIIHFEALGKHIIILNTVEDADELLEKRTSNYSNRAVMPMAELIGWDFIMPLLQHNDKWRPYRRICQQNFRKAESPKYFPLITQKVHEMLQGLLEQPEAFDKHNKMMSVAIPLSSMYGYDVKALDDPCVKAADESTIEAATLLLPSNLVNIIPPLAGILASVPGSSLMKAAARVRHLTNEMMRIPTEYVEKQFAEGKAIPSLVTDMLERKFVNGVSEEEEEAIKNIAYTVYGGASDTTISLTKSFFFYMATNPSVQEKAQAEIDRVVGSKRLPDFKDRNSTTMPYIEAIYLELLRLASPLPLCVPHAVAEDDHYKGYLIPKGAIVFPNLWAMGHDENKYPDPSSFKPERFLDEFGQLKSDNRTVAYGFGRRACVGKYVGSSTVWFMIVSVLACFTIEKAKDKNGQYIEIDDEFEEFGLIRHKAKYECVIKIRSSEAQHLILNTTSA